MCLRVLVDDPWGWTQITTLAVSRISILPRYASRTVEYDESNDPLPWQNWNFGIWYVYTDANSAQHRDIGEC